MKAIIVAALLLPELALAQVPPAISFQGRLLKSDGTPETGSPSITFRIYDAGAGGNQVWSEIQTVKLTNGFYAVQLGSQTAFTSDVFNGAARWLGVQVDGDSEMVPRQYIATVPYAFKAARADSATSATSASSATNASHATAADSVAWTGVSSKPTSFPPAAHQHAGSDITSAVAEAAHATAADTATTATSATSATNATNVTGGTVTTSKITLSAGGTANIPGLVLGGYSVAYPSGCNNSSCQLVCSGAWGKGECVTSSSGRCNGGTTLIGGFCITQ